MSLPMSASAQSSSPSAERLLDEALAALREKAGEFARLAPIEKAKLLRACIPRIADAAAGWVAAGTKAKGLPTDDPEEWLTGPVPTMRLARLLAESLEAIAKHGRPALGAGARERGDGRLEIGLFPASGLDKVLFSGFDGHALMQEGVDLDSARSQQASFYHQRDPEGGISLILGAGNVSAIPPTDCLTKMFIEGYVCLLKMNPVNEWAGQYLERALAPLISRGYLRIVYGGADVGGYLVDHDSIDDVHITGSDRTHDLIVWGPPGPERDQRKKDKTPLLKVPISSELGNVSPVAIAPYTYSDDELAFQARNIVTMITNNNSFNCNAAKMVITAKGWAQREQFFAMVERGLSAMPPKLAYYPGAQQRYEALTDGHGEIRTFGARSEGRLPWTILRNVDASDTGNALFTTEPFCPIVSETQVGSADPVDFLDAATRFMNDVLWGTLNACVVIHPKLESDSTIGKALDRAIVDLRYGTVAINHWPALCFGLGSTPWGGHPSATLDNIQSGIGWVHNSYMLEGMDKTVIRGPLRARPTPIWFAGNRKTGRIAPKLLAMEAAPAWRKLPGLLLRSL